MGKRFAIGDKFGRLTLVEKVIKDNGKQLGWICRCECGNTKLIKNVATLSNGTSKSCGCLRSELLKVNNPMFNLDTKKWFSDRFKADPERIIIIKRAVELSKTEETKEKRKQTNVLKYGGVAPAHSKEIQEKMKKTNIKEYGGIAPACSGETRDKMKATNLEKFGVENAMQNHAISSKLFSQRGPTKPEKKMDEFLTNNNIEFIYQGKCGETHKAWDFVVYKEGIPCLVIEIDGEFFHGTCSDPDGNACGGLKDHLRFGLVPEGVRYIQVDSKKVEDSFDEILKLFNIDYEKYIKDMVDSCIGSPFPYPVEEETKMRKSYYDLCRFEREKISGVRFGYSIIMNFHKSVWSCHKSTKMSPLDAWEDPVVLERCIRNRIIYKGMKNLSSMRIVQGFSVSSIAPRVSIFSPSLARGILNRYAGECKTVVDPFSGFSGRMLGATSLKMHYTGYDIREEAVAESQQIVDFLKIPDIKLEVSSIESLEDKNEYDVLITCPPYGFTEIWSNKHNYMDEDYYIDLCLNKFNCKKYIFVVRNTKKYKNNIVEYIEGESHIAKSKEAIIVITK